MSPPRIAITDGFSIINSVASQLHKAGAQCIHTLSSPDIPAFFTRSFQPEHYERDLGYVADVDELVSELARLKVDRVVAGSEPGVLLADRLNARLNTPGNRPETSLARRDKALMGDVVAAAGLATPRGRAFTQVQDAVRWFADAGLHEAVVKPVDSAGTDNVWFCHDPESVAAACERVLTHSNVYGAPNRKVLVQERVRGEEYYINSVSDDGIHRVPEIWRYVKRPGPTGSPIYDYEIPVPLSSPLAAELREFTVAILDALGIISSPAHTEIILTERGPVFIETGARLGGCTVPEIVQRYFGVSQAHLYAATLLDHDRLVKFDEQAAQWSIAVRFVYLINFVSGMTASLDWVKRLEEIPSVAAPLTTIEPGTWLDATTKLAESPGYLYLLSPDQDEVDRDYELVRELEQAGLYTEKSPPD